MPAVPSGGLALYVATENGVACSGPWAVNATASKRLLVFPSRILLKYPPDHSPPLQVALPLLSFRTARYHAQMLFSREPPPAVLVPVHEGLGPGSGVCYMMGSGSSHTCLLVKE